MIKETQNTILTQIQVTPYFSDEEKKEYSEKVLGIDSLVSLLQIKSTLDKKIEEFDKVIREEASKRLQEDKLLS